MTIKSWHCRQATDSCRAFEPTDQSKAQKHRIVCSKLAGDIFMTGKLQRFGYRYITGLWIFRKRGDFCIRTTVYIFKNRDYTALPANLLPLTRTPE